MSEHTFDFDDFIAAYDISNPEPDVSWIEDLVASDSDFDDPGPAEAAAATAAGRAA